MERNLFEYYPEPLREFKEIRVLSDTEQEEVEQLEKAQKALLADQFVTTATENGISRWEAILGTQPRVTASLDERKFAILTRLSQELPYSMGMLRRQMNFLCGEEGYSLELKNQEYLLIVRIALVSRNSYKDVARLLKRIVPANLAIDLSLLYNRYSMVKVFTHRQLKAYSHDGIRNEVELIGRENNLLWSDKAIRG